MQEADLLEPEPEPESEPEPNRTRAEPARKNWIKHAEISSSRTSKSVWAAKRLSETTEEDQQILQLQRRQRGPAEEPWDQQ